MRNAMGKEFNVQNFLSNDGTGMAKDMTNDEC
jgi:hypothetical protein